MEGEPNWEGCEYSKCGRTDRGVSAFGQVVGIRVRSNRPLSKLERPEIDHKGVVSEKLEEDGLPNTLDLASQALHPELASEGGQSTPTSPLSLSDETLAFHHVYDEIPYCQVLNRLLPPDIRVLAWCPAPPLDFSARFSCRERRYKYFFTQPAFTPTVGGCRTRPGQSREGWLDISAMRNAAQRFEGLHDFRNFCKVDPSKQIENFERRIFYANIEQLDAHNAPASYMGDSSFSQYEDLDNGPAQHPEPNHTEQTLGEPKLYTFTLHGSAFLWHQVRHMVSILFLIGQGLESPSLVDDLLDIHKTPCKPQYEMADDAPLVLWDCIFPREGSGSREDAMAWLHVGDPAGIAAHNGTEKRIGGKFGVGGAVDEIWRTWRGRKIDEVLAGALLNVVVGQSPNNVPDEDEAKGDKSSRKVFQGGNGPRRVGRYVPVMQKPKMESVVVVNARYAKRKGLFERGKEMNESQSKEVKEKGFRTVRC